jgi:hypothetical protein
MALPLPVHRSRWDEGAAAFARASAASGAEERRKHLVGCARAMDAAFGLGADEALVGWWEARLPMGR